MLLLISGYHGIGCVSQCVFIGVNIVQYLHDGLVCEKCMWSVDLV